MTLTPIQIEELNKRIYYNCTVQFRRFNYLRNPYASYFHDCAQYMWMLALRNLEISWDGSCKPTSFLKDLRLKQYAIKFFQSMGWVPNYYRVSPLPQFVSMDIGIRNPLKRNKALLLREVLV